MTDDNIDRPHVDTYFDENRTHWNDLTHDLSGTKTADRIESFLNGETGLLPIEREEVGDVTEKRLLHLQCLVGLRTLSWAREGATVTGVDFSSEAIDTARQLASDAGLEERATFIEANVYDLPDVHDERYDVVYTAFGVLCWFPDLDAWAEVVTECLEPGGIFYLAELHPLAGSLSFDFESDEAPIRVEYPYFMTDTPITAENGPPYKWAHSVGETLSALIDAGIELIFVHEYPFLPTDLFPGMVKDEQGNWRFENGVDLPLMITVKGTLER